MKFFNELEKLGKEREALKANAEAKLKEVEQNLDSIKNKVDKLKSQYFLRPSEETEAAANEAIKELKAAQAEYDIKVELLEQLKKVYLLEWSKDDLMNDLDQEYKRTGLDGDMEKYKKLYTELHDLENNIRVKWETYNSLYNIVLSKINRLYLNNADRELCDRDITNFIFEKQGIISQLGDLNNISIPRGSAPQNEIYHY